MTFHSKEPAKSIPGFLVPHGFVRALQRGVFWGDGTHLGGASDLSGRRPSCRFEPDGEVMLAAHPRLLLFKFDRLPVLVGGPFAQNLRCII